MTTDNTPEHDGVYVGMSDAVPLGAANASAPGPYARAAGLWWGAGWFGALPVVGKDLGLPTGFTGHMGVWPSPEQVTLWARERGNDNIAIRVPRNVIGIDVDAYDGRVGLQTIDDFETQYGELPPTWVSTSRDDGSGIRLYVVPEDITWVSDLGSKSDVQIIRHEHRYFIACPSIHPDTNRQYYLKTPIGSIIENPPRPEQLAQLPLSWVAALTKKYGTGIDLSTEQPDVTSMLEVDNSSNNVDPALMLFIGAEPGEQDQRLFEYVCSMRSRKFKVEEAMVFAMAAVGQMVHSRPAEPWTAELARQKVIRIWNTIPSGTSYERVTSDRQRAWARGVVDSLAVLNDGVDTQNDTITVDNNLLNNGNSITSSTRDSNIIVSDDATGTSDHVPENLTDTGNAMRYARLFAGKHLRYIPEYRQWHVWNGARWKNDTRNTALDLTRLVAGDIRADAEQVIRTVADDARAQVVREYGTWAQTSESERTRRAMLVLASTLPAFIVHAVELDADPRLLGCENGVIELLDDGWKFRPGMPEDNISLSTGVIFDPDAQSDAWDNFISYVQPDITVRTHLQALDGYVLQGVNSERYWIILKGDTTTGKSTYLEVVNMTLGEYSTVANISIFVGNTQERARADLVHTLTKRRVHMSEIEASTQLHAEQIKRMTGRDQISARPPYGKEYITRIPAFTPITAMNGLPTIRDADVAIRKRIRPVPFSVRLDTENVMVNTVRELTERTPKAAILNWLLEGWNLYRKGTLDIPVAANTELALDINDQLSGISGFIETYCEVDAEYSDMAERLFIAYQIWEVNEGVRSKDKCTLTAFGLMLERAGYPRARSRSIITCSDGVQRKKTLRCGIRVRPEWMATVYLRASVHGMSI